jgi:hypothetical protein
LAEWKRAPKVYRLTGKGEIRMDKQQAWYYALGIIKVDGLEPSREFLDMAEKEKRGEIMLKDIKLALDAKYRIKRDTLPNE